MCKWTLESLKSQQTAEILENGWSFDTVKHEVTHNLGNILMGKKWSCDGKMTSKINKFDVKLKSLILLVYFSVT